MRAELVGLAEVGFEVERVDADLELLDIARGDGDLRDLVGAESALGGDAERFLREHDDAGFGRLRPRAPGEAAEGGEGVLELAELLGLEDAGAVERER